MHTLNKSSRYTEKVILHSFTIGDVEDPMLYAAPPIGEWQQTEKGQWCMQHCEGEIVFHSMQDHISWGHKIVLQGELSPENLTYFRLKWGQ